MLFILPLGPTDNRRLIPAWRMKRLVSSAEYRAWKEEAIWRVKEQMPKGFKAFNPTFEKQLPFRIKVFLPNKRTDGANYTKGAEDVLTKAGVWRDDKYCLPSLDRIEIDAKNPRIEVEIL